MGAPAANTTPAAKPAKPAAAPVPTPASCCGKPLAATSKFCTECGKPNPQYAGSGKPAAARPAQAVVAKAAGAGAGAGVATCYTCGERVITSLKFWSHSNLRTVYFALTNHCITTPPHPL